jgi:hypothetical protein
VFGGAEALASLSTALFAPVPSRFVVNDASLESCPSR